MSESPYTLVAGQQTDGTFIHTGRLVVSVKLATGVVAKVTLPDDLYALMAHMAALEARLPPEPAP
jgi:hypothetical protein